MRTMIGVVIFSIVILLLLNTLTFFQVGGEGRFLSLNGVKGSALVVEGVEYTLNFEQQNKLIEWVNRAVPIGANETTVPSNLEKIIVYLFDEEPIEIAIIGEQQNQLLFSVPKWQSKGFLRDVSRGELLNMLTQAYPKEPSKNKMNLLTSSKSPKIDDQKWGCITKNTTPFSIVDFRLIWRGEKVHFNF